MKLNLTNSDNKLTKIESIILIQLKNNFIIMELWAHLLSLKG